MSKFFDFYYNKRLLWLGEIQEIMVFILKMYEQNSISLYTMEIASRFF